MLRLVAIVPVNVVAIVPVSSRDYTREVKSKAFLVAFLSP